MTGTLNYTCSTLVVPTPSTPPVEIFSNLIPGEAMDSKAKCCSISAICVTFFLQKTIE